MGFDQDFVLFVTLCKLFPLIIVMQIISSESNHFHFLFSPQFFKNKKVYTKKEPEVLSTFLERISEPAKCHGIRAGGNVRPFGRVGKMKEVLIIF